MINEKKTFEEFGYTSDGYANNPEKQVLLENGATLCEICHKKFNKKYGQKNNTKEQFIEFMEE